MTRLTLNKNPGEKFAARDRNTATGLEDDSVIFYNEITKVHVVPERESFTIQVVAPDVEIEMDFANAQDVREALAALEVPGPWLQSHAEKPNLALSAGALGTT